MARSSSDKPSGPSRRRRRVIKRGSRAIDSNNKHNNRQKQSQGAKKSRSPRPANNKSGTSIPTVRSSTVADSSTSFADLGVPDTLVKVLKDEGATHPFPIQAAAIPQALEGRDVLGRGPTGSGKTFTFGVPMIARLMGAASRPQKPRGLVLAPTRELASQIRQRLEPIANAAGQRVLEVVGGVKIQRNVTALARPVDILIATPGRAQDLLNQGFISFEDVSIVAIDEADHMADMGFLPQVTKLMNDIDPQAQHLLFSATLDGDVQILVDKYLRNPVTHSTGEATATVDRMDHILGVMADRDERNEAVIDLAQLGVKTVMFMRTKHAVDRQMKKLVRQKVSAVALHGNKGQSTREKALEAFANGDAQVLVATDIAARGIDVKNVELVVHIDPPAEHKAYVHRAGRTARAGSEGTVVTLTYSDIKDETLKMMKKAGVKPTIDNKTHLIKNVRKLVK